MSLAPIFATLQPRRKSPRLTGYDYAASGAYFVTICTYARLHLFGEIIDSKMVLNAYGQIAQNEWQQTAIKRSNITLDAFVVMPNHVHGIIIINGKDAIQGEARLAPTMVGTLSAVVGAFKSTVTKHIHYLPSTPEHPIWQRSFHDHIIRNAQDAARIYEYIVLNPARWSADQLFT